MNMIYTPKTMVLIQILFAVFFFQSYLNTKFQFYSLKTTKTLPSLFIELLKKKKQNWEFEQAKKHLKEKSDQQTKVNNIELKKKIHNHCNPTSCLITSTTTTTINIIKKDFNVKPKKKDKTVVVNNQPTQCKTSNKVELKVLLNKLTIL